MGSQKNQSKKLVALQAINQDKTWKYMAITMTPPIRLQRVVFETFEKRLIGKKAGNNET